MNLSSLLLKLAGWKVKITTPDYDKSIICVAPHTSNWDFILGKLAYASVGRKAGFLMKETWFFFPLGFVFKAMGGIPVPRSQKNKHGSLVESIVRKFRESEKLNIAITPEGTRSRTDKWRTGFLQISYLAQVPCVLGAIDYAKKEILVEHTFQPTGNVDDDIRAIKDFYRPFAGKYPEKFTTE